MPPRPIHSRPAPTPGRLVGPRVRAPKALTESLIAQAALDLPPASDAAREITVDALDLLVTSVLAGKLSDSPGIRYGDDRYYLPTIAEITLIVQASQVDRKTYMQERFDCDDFSYVLKGEMSAHAYDTGDLRLGLCSGIVWGYFDWTGDDFHAVNWAVASDESIWLIEPQTDDIYPIERCTGGITLLLV